MSAELHLGSAAGKNFTIPADFATQTCGIIARKGAGKTYTGAVLAEELLHAGTQVVVIDPLDVWWGLRSSADGKEQGHAIIVFGGEHGDLPLSEAMGEQIADLVVEHRLSAVLSLDHLSKNGQRQFMTAFAEQLYQKKNPSATRTPVHLFLDEADMFCPQRVQHGQERMLGAVDSLVRRGRTRGIGVTMITQRPATIHKDVFTQIEVLIALQLTSPQDRKAVEEWVQAYDTHGHRATFMASLAGLQQGQAWVWSPSWLDCFQRIQVRRRSTFNSSATPKSGDRPIEPKAKAAVDLDELRSKLATVVEQAKANDPTLLKKEIARLKKDLAEKPAPYQSTPEEIQKQVANAVAGERRRLLDQVHAAVAPIQQLIADLDRTPKPVAVAPVAAVRQMPQPDRSAPRRSTAPGEKMGRCERAILTALAQHPSGRTKVHVAVLTGYAHNGGGFGNAIGALRSRGWIESQGDALVITGHGVDALGEYEPLPTGTALLRHWIGQLGRAERLILEALAESWPAAFDKHSLAERTGYAADGGGFTNALGRLRTLELIEGRGAMKASAHLMESA